MLSYLDHHTVLGLRWQRYSLSNFSDDLEITVLDVWFSFDQCFLIFLYIDLLALAHWPVCLLCFDLHKDAAFPCGRDFRVAIHQFCVGA
jgi:hypothetical protein